MSEGTRRDLSGVYERCIGCRAPFRIPFPPDWSIDAIKRGSRHGPTRSSLMPHLPRCIMRPIKFPNGDGVAIRLPGSLVVNLDFDLPGTET